MQLRCEARWAISGTPTTSLRSAPDTDASIPGAASAPGGSEKDFNRLGQLISRFVRHPAFPKPEVWRGVFTTPMLEQGRGGARLLRTLSAVVVKNQPDKVEEAFRLPPLRKETVMLRMNGAERLMYNCLLSLFCINAITSQRTDVSGRVRCAVLGRAALELTLLASAFCSKTTCSTRRSRSTATS